jgi:hypothetical protein
MSAEGLALLVKALPSGRVRGPPKVASCVIGTTAVSEDSE